MVFGRVKAGRCRGINIHLPYIISSDEANNQSPTQTTVYFVIIPFLILAPHSKL